jgi:hypothetical protein
MQQNTALKQRKSCLSRGAAFDPFHCVTEPLDHAVVPRLTPSVGDRLCVVGQSVSKVHEFPDATGLDGGFPLFQSRFPFSLPQQLPKRLGQGEGGCSRQITLAELIKESGLVWCSVLGGTNDHERGTASRRHFLERDGLLADRFCPAPTKCFHHVFNRPQRSWISLSHHLFLELNGLMTPAIASITERGERRVSEMMGPVASFSASWLLMFQCAIDTAGADPDDACNLLSSVTSTKQLPDLLVATNARSIAAPAFPLGRLGSDRLRRRNISSQLSCCLFEQRLVVTKELLQGLGKILLQMEAVNNVFGLGSTRRDGFAEEFTTITRDEVSLGVLLEPSGTRLDPTLPQQRS